MKYLEIIKFRTTRTDRKYIELQLLNLMFEQEKNNKGISIKIYIRDLVDSDFLIELAFIERYSASGVFGTDSFSGNAARGAINQDHERRIAAGIGVA